VFSPAIGRVDIGGHVRGVSSLPYTVTVNPTDPGIFTVAAMALAMERS